jgi:hypothetical protein
MPRDSRFRTRWCGVIVVALTACGPSFDALDGGVGGGSSGVAATNDAIPDDDGDDENDDDARLDEGHEGGVADDDDGGDHPGFIQPADGGSMNIECDVWAQDCTAGEKCTWWANDGGNAWNATKCVPIVPDPDQPGESCTVMGTGVSGLDSCDLAAMCWNVDPETHLGTCVSFCMGSEANPTCPQPAMHCVGRTPMLCVPQCCPLEQDCSDGEGCYVANEAFYCIPDAGGDQGAFGDACEFINVCDPGLFCASPDQVLGCAGGIGCCTNFCLLGSQQCAAEHPGMECLPWFEEDQAPPGFEHTGGCLMPL